MSKKPGYLIRFSDGTFLSESLDSTTSHKELAIKFEDVRGAKCMAKICRLSNSRMKVLNFSVIREDRA